MYGSINTWIKLFRENDHLKLDIQLVSNRYNNLVELGLVRNCIIHNNGIVNEDLHKMTNKPRFQVGARINITDKDLRRYKESTKEFCKVLSSLVVRKYKTNQIS